MLPRVIAKNFNLSPLNKTEASTCIDLTVPRLETKSEHILRMGRWHLADCAVESDAIHLWKLNSLETVVAFVSFHRPV